MLQYCQQPPANHFTQIVSLCQTHRHLRAASHRTEWPTFLLNLLPPVYTIYSRCLQAASSSSSILSTLCIYLQEWAGAFFPSSVLLYIHLPRHTAATSSQPESPSSSSTKNVVTYNERMVAMKKSAAQNVLCCNCVRKNWKNCLAQLKLPMNPSTTHPDLSLHICCARLYTVLT